jgi:hypothetical protein
MRNIVLVKTGGKREAVREFAIAHAEWIAPEGMVCHHMDGCEGVAETGWAAMVVSFRSPDAERVLAEHGAVVWPHILDHENVLEDHHHKGLVPEHVGIKTGDSPFVAAKKMRAALGPIFEPRVF